MLRRVLRLARMLCALMYRQNGDLANLLTSARKKVPQSARLSGGGGGGAIANRGDMNCIGASLTH